VRSREIFLMRTNENRRPKWTEVKVLKFPKSHSLFLNPGNLSIVVEDIVWGQ